MIGAAHEPGAERPAQRERGREMHGGLSDDADLETLLASALERLVEATGVTRACAWGQGSDGALRLIAATHRDGTPAEAPDESAATTLEPLWTLERPVDLSAAGASSGLSRFAARYGMRCAMPLVSPDGEHIAMLLLGDTDDRPEHVRPRTLAALDSAVQRLRTPAAAATALERLRELDANVCRLDRLAALGDLLAEVAHEIRNPLVSMKTFLHLLPDRLDDAEFQGKFRNVVLEELQRMERLLDALVDHARPVAKRIASDSIHEGANLERALSSLLRLLEQRAAERDVRLVAEVDANDIAIGEDALRQILLNLILNALDVAPASSTITVRSELTEGRVQFSVEDQGAGVSKGLRSRLFEPFFSTRDDRAGGLGLAITKKLIEDAHGSIHVESSGTGGARFCVSLPCV